MVGKAAHLDFGELLFNERESVRDEHAANPHAERRVRRDGGRPVARHARRDRLGSATTRRRRSGRARSVKPRPGGPEVLARCRARRGLRDRPRLFPASGYVHFGDVLPRGSTTSCSPPWTRRLVRGVTRPPAALRADRRARRQLRADGVGQGRAAATVVGKHALKNAAIPAVTVLGLPRVPARRTLVIEQIFAIPGIGSYLLRCVTPRPAGHPGRGARVRHYRRSCSACSSTSATACSTRRCGCDEPAEWGLYASARSPAPAGLWRGSPAPRPARTARLAGFRRNRGAIAALVFLGAPHSSRPSTAARTHDPTLRTC